MPIIVGSPRSGTTLLRLMIDAHPQVAIPPETGFLYLGLNLVEGDASPRENFFVRLTQYPPEAPGWNDFHLDAGAFRTELDRLEPFDLADGLRAFYRLYAARWSKPRWGEKTPLYCRHLQTIERILPEAHFIHLIRDGRDATISLRERWFSPGHGIAIQASYWRDNVLTAREEGQTCGHYIEVRFEDLICNTESELRRICNFIKIDFDSRMLAHHEGATERLAEHLQRHRSDGSVLVSRDERLRQQQRSSQAPDPARIGTWRLMLSRKEAEVFNSIAGDALALFGYPLN